MGKVAPGWRLHKCSSREHLPQDRISQLPHDILICILSFLTFKEAARTSVLSKRWKDLSKYFPSLDFDGSEALDKIVESERKSGDESVRERETCKYVDWVNKVLQSHKATVLDELRVHFDLDHSYQETIDKWIQFAFARKVQRLELGLSAGYKFNSVSVKPCTFPNVSLGIVGSSGRCSRAYFKSLKSLTLNRVEVSEEVLQFFLHHCQSLERLVVRRSYNLISLEVSAPSPTLKHLEICYFMERLTVSDANLVSLKTDAKTLVLKNVQMLVDVYLFGWRNNACGAVTSQLSCCLLNLEALTFFIDSREVIQLKGMIHELPQLPKLKQLTLRVIPGAGEDKSLLGLTCVTKASPNLEKLVLKLEWTSERVMNRRKLEEAANYPLQHLKVFELSGYFGRTCEVELVKFFCKNAINLEKIIINPEDHPGLPKSPQEIKEQQVARRHAKRQLKGLVPSNVELDIL